MNSPHPLCRHCGSDRLVRNGIAPNGKQKYLCHACGKQSRANPGSNAHSAARRDEILRAFCYRTETLFASGDTGGGSVGKRKRIGMRLPSRRA